jgi:hypothetical protein
MAELSADEIRALAEGVAVAANTIVERERKRASERIYGFARIAIECGVAERQLRRWVRRNGFPLDRDPIGLSVVRSSMERWLEARRHAVQD